MTISTRSPVRRLAIASWVFVTVSVVLILQAIGMELPKHGTDAEWIAHARFHLVAGAGFQIGSGLTAILIARGPFLRAERWSWFALLVYTLSFAVHIPAAVWQGSGPPVGAWYIISTLLTAMFLGLAGTWPLTNSQNA